MKMHVWGGMIFFVPCRVRKRCKGWMRAIHGQGKGRDDGTGE